MGNEGEYREDMVNLRYAYQGVVTQTVLEHLWQASSKILGHNMKDNILAGIRH